jgi:hypothetical protein
MGMKKIIFNEKLFYYIIQVAPLEIVVVIILFWQYVKYIAFIAVGYTLFLLIIQTSFGRLFVYLRFEILGFVSI